MRNAWTPAGNVIKTVGVMSKRGNSANHPGAISESRVGQVRRSSVLVIFHTASTEVS